MSLSEFPGGDREIVPGVPAAVYAAAAIKGQKAAIAECVSRVSAPVTVLDIGSGTGSFSRALQECCNHPENKYYWIDIDKERMEAGRKELWFSDRISTVHADLRTARDLHDIPNGEIDVILTGLLHHYLPRGSYAKTLSTIIERKLGPNGLTILVEMAASSFSNNRSRHEQQDQNILQEMRMALSSDGVAPLESPMRIEVPVVAKETNAHCTAELFLSFGRRHEKEEQLWQDSP